MTTGGTRAGVVLGTAAYMSPEQARGHVVDRRTDIWAFGCILFEMLTGKLLFPGATVSDTIAAVLRADIDLSALPADVPPSVRRLLERCLDRDPATRLRDIGEARIVLADPRATTAIRIAAGGDSGVHRARPPAWSLVAIAVVALGLGLPGGSLLTRPAPPPECRDSSSRSRTRRAGWSSGPSRSPRTARTSCTAAVRRTDRRSCACGGSTRRARVLPGTRGGRLPFWSPDGSRIGFFSGNALYRIGLDGGGASQIALLPDIPMGGTWSAGGVILIGTEAGPLHRVGVEGGTPEPVTTVEAGVEDCHVWPAFFPDGRSFVLLADATTDAGHRLTIGSLDDRKTKVLRTAIRSAILVDPAGSLLLVEDGQLYALPFDFRKAEITGPQILVEDHLQAIGQHHELPLALSAGGILALQRGTDAAMIQRIPLDGAPPGMLAPPDRYRNPRIFRDGRRIAHEMQSSGFERTT